MLQKYVKSISRTWHKCLMNYNYTLYHDCLDQEMKEQYYQKATRHSLKLSDF